MIITIFELVACSNIDGEFALRTNVFKTFNEAKKEFDKLVKEDEDDIAKSAECRGVAIRFLDDEKFNEEVEDLDYVIDKKETSYTSYVQGEFGTSFVSIDIKEHALEVK